MPPADKLELIRVLNVAEIIRQLLEAEDNLSKAQANGHGMDDEQEELFKEKLARVLNILGMELTKIIDEVCVSVEAREMSADSRHTDERHRRPESDGFVVRLGFAIAHTSVPRRRLRRYIRHRHSFPAEHHVNIQKGQKAECTRSLVG